ncbi:MAG: triose-phosphate isomerase [Thermoanaerobaculia bacterium]
MSGPPIDSRTPPIPRSPLVAGNWKMNLIRWEADSLCQKLRASLPLGTEVAVFPSYPLLPTVVEALAGSGIGIGGQDVHAEAKGAFTGDVSAAQLVDVGCSWALCGHSERRQAYGESDELAVRKAVTAARAGLKPLLCVGESREAREDGQTFAVLERQLGPLAALAPEGLPELVLAYEPVWAIGTGETATPGIVQEVHFWLRERLRVLWGARAGALRIVYGGSVTPENSGGLAALPDVDGSLVGGASFDASKFLAIISSFAA